MLCPACCHAIQQIEAFSETDTDDGEHYHFYAHHASLNDFETAVEQGCYICTSLRNHILDPDWDQIEHLAWNLDVGLVLQMRVDMDEIRRYRIEALGWKRLKAILEIVSEKELNLGNDGCWTIHLREYRHDIKTTFSSENAAALQSLSATFRDSGWAAICSSQTFASVSSGADSVLDQASRWLNTCINSHDSCRYDPNLTRSYPPLLMDLQPLDLGIQFWRLVSSKDLSKGASYATISHRWSNPDEITKLTSDTAGLMQRGMHVESLYLLYQDIIKVVRHIGIRYLWIDSICIRQDKALDIRAAAEGMAEIYNNATVNISALHARSRLFSSRHPAYVDLTRIYLDAATYGLMRTYVVDEEYSFYSCFADSPLTKRGWVLQEQLLAKRTLYFSNHQLMWLCSLGGAMETSPEISIKHSEQAFFGFRETQALQRSYYMGNIMKPEKEGRLMHDIELTWNTVVREFSRRRLTYADDRLIAIAGMAKLVSRATSTGGYLAGLWSTTLPGALLWHVVPSEYIYSSSRRPPSWSWASVDTSVGFPVAGIAISKFLTGNTVPRAGHKYDHVDRGVLCLRAAVIELHPWSVPMLQRVGLPLELSIQPGRYGEIVIIETESLDVVLDTKELCGAEHQLHLAFIDCHHWPGFEVDVGEFEFRGLLLAPDLNEAQPQSFRRVGVFTLRKWMDGREISWFSDVQEYVVARQEYSEKWDFSGDGMKDIDLI